MRYSMIYLFIGIFNVASAMEKPPEVPAKTEQKMKITQQQLIEESTKPTSYLSLLPVDLKKLVKLYAYNTLEEVIFAIRSEYLNDPAKRDKLLNDVAFNEALINELAQRFRRFDSERDTTLVKQQIALLLNTPASFILLKKMLGPDKSWHVENFVFPVFKNYIEKLHLNYQEALAYARTLFENINQYKIVNDEIVSNPSGLIIKIMEYFVEKFKDTFEKNNVIPYIKVLVDIGGVEAQNWIKRIIDIYLDSEYRGENERFLRVLLLQRYSEQELALLGSRKEIIQALRTAVCDSLAILLLQALNKNDHERIKFLVLSIFSVEFPEETFEECFAQKLKGQLGQLLVEYLVTNDNAKPFKHTFYPTDMVVPLWDYAINNTNATPHKIITLLSCIILDWMAHEELYYRNSYRLVRQRKMRNKFFFDAVQSPYADVSVIQNLGLNVDYNTADDEGVTVLMHAIQNGHFDIANLLLTIQDININACDSNGHNALSFARLLPQSKERDALIATLIERGAQEELTCVLQ